MGQHRSCCRILGVRDRGMGRSSNKNCDLPIPPSGKHDSNAIPLLPALCFACSVASLVLGVHVICVAFCEYPFFTLLPRLCTATPALWLEDPALVLSSVRMQFLTSLLEVPPEKVTCVTSPPRYFVDPPTYERVPVDSLTDSGHLYAPTWDSGSPSTSNETCRRECSTPCIWWSVVDNRWKDYGTFSYVLFEE